MLQRPHQLAVYCTGKYIALGLVMLTICTKVIQGKNSPHPNGATAAEQARRAEMCRNFTVGNKDRKEFYSPGYPGFYPNQTECTRILTAPPGHFIRLDFRDKFHLEPSVGCKYDFLEIRDGAHGYSEEKGRFCDRTFPKIITSSGRYLWLKFVSDEDIEYTGFRAVYQYIPNSVASPRDIEDCRYEVDGVEGIIDNSMIPGEKINFTKKHNIAIDCTWVVKVKVGYKISLFFATFELAEPNECDVNFIAVYAARTDAKHRLGMYCGAIAEQVSSDGHIVQIRFFAETSGLASKFNIIFTAFRDKGDVPCYNNEYDCDDATCIDNSLVCNGRFNCKFRWDEDKEKCQTTQKASINFSSEHIIIILVIGCLILFGMCFTMFFNCIRKLRQDRREMQEYRRSRERGIDNVGQTPPSGASSPYQTHRIRTRPDALDDTGCYVPGGDLATILSKRTNGDALFVKPETEEDEEEADAYHVEMKDSECQTRDSLFQNRDMRTVPRDSHKNGGNTTPPPPPPPSRSRPPGTSTDPRKTRLLDRLAANVPRNDEPEKIPMGEYFGQPTHAQAQRFRAEAVIEMTQRPCSMDSSKSAPDVIVTH